LIDNFYPKVDKLAYYHVKLKLPKRYIPVSEAESITQKNEWYIFDFPYPRESVDIFIRKDYKIYTLKVRDNLTIYGYFYKNGSKKLLEYTKNYILEYEKLFGKFPYKRFSIVETSYPLGNSFPTFTAVYTFLLGKDFILRASLPHEILHQWFGCSVYLNDKEGNWTEGLTTYFSDYYFNENKKIYRKTILEKFDAIADKKLPLKDFKYKKNKSYEAVGYGKGMFFFYMLENLVGKKTFIKSLRDFYKKNKFKKATYQDIKKSVEKYYKKDLTYFFNQWINKTYIPEIDIKIKDVYYNLDHFDIDLTLTQKQNFKIQLPLILQTTDGKEEKTVDIFYKKENVRLKTKALPLKMYIDPEYKLFRNLSNEETDPILYYGYKFLSLNSKHLNKDFKISDIENKTVLFIDNQFDYLKNIIGNLKLPDGKFVMITKNPLGDKKFILLTNTKDYYRRMILYYGNYSMVVYENPEKNRKNFCFYCNFKQIYNLPEVINVNKGATDFYTFLKDIENKKIIYIGENHTDFEDHIIQLEIIKQIYKKYPKVAIGMEMLQKPFQKYVDEYINGNLSEKEFLKKVEYYKRWGYDYRLYKPIFDFAKKNKIKVLALNIEKEITEKIRKCGIGCLSEEERKKIPKDLDFSNKRYREFLKKIYNRHKSDKSFTHFYENQVVWDETMADTVSNFMKKNQEYKLVILAGNGHLRYRYGIPDRVKRRTGIKGVVILNNDETRENIADYIVYMERIKYKESPKLGVYIEEKNGKVVVKQIIKNSIAYKTGIKKGDIILQLGDTKIKDIADLKLALTFLKRNSSLKILRNNKVLTLKIRL